MRPFWYKIKCFDKEECEFLKEFSIKEETSKTFNDGNWLRKFFVRKSKTGWFSYGENSEVDNIINKAVNLLFKVSMEEYNIYLNYVEPIQRTRYKTFGHYKGHFDVGSNGPLRIMSATLELSDPNKYWGGGISFPDLKQQPKLDQGDLLVFPSLLKHKANVVYKGTRQSLVLWGTHDPLLNNETEKDGT